MASHPARPVNVREGVRANVATVAWTWRYETGTGSAVSGVTAETFPTQADAETWIGENWRDLREAGVDQVVLLENDRAVYGPMSLHGS